MLALRRLRLGAKRGTLLQYVILHLRVALTQPRNVPPLVQVWAGTPPFPIYLAVPGVRGAAGLGAAEGAAGAPLAVVLS